MFALSFCLPSNLHLWYVFVRFLSLFVPHRSFFWYLGMAVHHVYGTYILGRKSTGVGWLCKLYSFETLSVILILLQTTNMNRARLAVLYLTSYSDTRYNYRIRYNHYGNLSGQKSIAKQNLCQMLYYLILQDTYVFDIC